MSPIVSLIIIVVLLALLYLGSSLLIFTIACFVGFLLSIYSSLHGLLITFLGILALVSLAFLMKPLRQKYISTPFFSMFKKMLPPLSDTEKEAIDAGTVWWDGQLFSGNPDWKSLIKIEKPGLSEEEQAFLDGPVVDLCRMSDAWKINHDWRVIPEHIINFVRENGFLGMIIPKEYGGLEFSAVAQSEVLIKISNTGGGFTNMRQYSQKGNEQAM